MVTNKSFEDIDKKLKLLGEEKRLMIEKSMSSNDPQKIIKAKEYLEKQKKSKKSEFKSYLTPPENEFYNGMGYKQSAKSITYDIMRKMSYTPIMNSIITTRVNQVFNFSKFSTDEQKEGWTIRKKPKRFQSREEAKVTDGDRNKMDYIATFIENGGLLQKWEQSDDFEEFIKKQTIDSLTFDQATFEVERKRNGQPYSFVSVDASTIRLLETINRGYRNENRYDVVNGHLPIYAQVWRGNIAEREIAKGIKEQIVFYPWELNFGTRNGTTDIRLNGYGKSELEILIDIITYQLYGVHYNGNFFKNGSNPRGFFSIKGDVNQGVMNEFKQAWRDTVQGWQNSHKTPVFEGDGDISWNDMGQSNRDMEFSNWNDFLVLLSCTVYNIDPSELGFNFQKQAQIFGQDGQRERLDHSKRKGLKPLLVFLQKRINKHIVSEIDPEFEFAWTGISIEDENAILEADVKKISNGMVSMEDMFRKYSDRDFNPDKDTILNQVYQQAKQSQQFGGEESNEAVDEMTGEPEEGVQNPFDEYQKADNPIFDRMNDYIQKNLT